MAYKTLLVHLELSGDNMGVLNIAAGLAERFGARVIGIAAGEPVQPVFDEFGATASIIVAETEELKFELEACRQQFNSALKSRVKDIEFRSAVLDRPVAAYIAEQARCADLIITGPDIGFGPFDNGRRANLGDLVLRAGRPVLIVPEGVTSLNFRHVFLAWKDAREARRAAVDGLPLLQAAGKVTAIEIVTQSGLAYAINSLKDVSSWLKQQGVTVDTRTIETTSDQVGYLRAELVSGHCDLLVAGAYGHSRLGEWVFGGVTCDVLLDPPCCVLISH